MLNTRTLVNVHERLSQQSFSALKEDDASRLIVDFLTLLEAVIVGKELFYDGTVGGDRLKKLNDAEDYLESHMDHPNASELVSPAIPASEDQLQIMCRTAAERGSATILNGLEKDAQAKFGGFDLGIYQSAIEQFANDIQMAQTQHQDRVAIAASVIAENVYPGSKCVGGIILAAANADGDTRDTALNACAQKLGETSHLDEQSKVLDFMMNAAFRPNLLPAVANDICDAALLAHEDIIESCAHQNFLSVDHIVRKSVRHNRERPEIEAIVRLISCDQTSFPWFGLFCFLQSKGDSPFAVLDDALVQRSKLAQFVNVEFTINPTFVREDGRCDQAVFNFVRGQYDNLFSYAQQFQLDKPGLWDTAFGLSSGSVAAVATTLGVMMDQPEAAAKLVNNPALLEQLADLAEFIEPVTEVMSNAPTDASSLASVLGEEHRELVRKLRTTAIPDETKCLVILHSLLTRQIRDIRKSEGSLGNLFRDRIEAVFRHSFVD